MLCIILNPKSKQSSDERSSSAEVEPKVPSPMVWGSIAVWDDFLTRRWVNSFQHMVGYDMSIVSYCPRPLVYGTNGL